MAGLSPIDVWLGVRMDLGLSTEAGWYAASGPAASHDSRMDAATPGTLWRPWAPLTVTERHSMSGPQSTTTGLGPSATLRSTSKTFKLRHALWAANFNAKDQVSKHLPDAMALENPAGFLVTEDDLASPKCPILSSSCNPDALTRRLVMHSQG